MQKPVTVLTPIGHDVVVDIKRLAQAWRYQIKCFFDVGANDGATARVALGAFAEADVYAFEPHPTTFARLRQSVSGPRFHAFNTALGDKRGETEFFCYGDDRVNSLVPDARFAVRLDRPALRSRSRSKPSMRSAQPGTYKQSMFSRLTQKASSFQ
jgi:hypothetical protein